MFAQSGYICGRKGYGDMGLLQQINSPDDLKKLNISQLAEYAEEVRRFLISNVSKTGGHLASNLGITELAVAIHYVFDSPNDKIIWDVGHQSYVHKIITGRRDRFETLRKYGGLSGFPKTAESEHDVFNTGHSSTSISAALGMLRAMRLDGNTNRAVAVIGDGAMTGGMVYEAMCDAGQEKNAGLIVILNDNEMSISANVGGIASHLSDLRSTAKYNTLKNRLSDKLETYPAVRNVVKRIKNSIKHGVLPNPMFEQIGFKYFGPYDGHDIEKLVKALRQIKKLPDNVVIHVITQKGRGYLPAEENPGKYHGVGNFSVSDGVIEPMEKDYSAVFGEKLTDMARKNPKIAAITAAMPESTGLGAFALEFSKRFFDVGIAEQHAVTMAGGLAMQGYIPVFAVYSSFLQRAYDQILHDIALQKLHVVFAVDRAGLTCGDGETHHGLYDISFLHNMPGMTVLAPSGFGELEKMIDYAVNKCSGPVAIRYPRGRSQADINHVTDIENGAECVADGTDVTIYALGSTLKDAFDVRELLCKENISTRIIDLRFASPLNYDYIKQNKNGVNVVMEESVEVLGEEIGNILESRVISFAYPNTPVPQGDEENLKRKFGLLPQQMAEKIMTLVGAELAVSG